MTACLLVTDSAFSVTADMAPDSCTGYILMTSAEYRVNQNPFADIDYPTLLTLLGFELGVFITAFACGFIARKLGR